MPLIGANGGLLGSQRTTTTSTGVGLWTPNEQVVSKRAGVWPLSGDPYFGYNSLLLHMDGSNGSTTFTDSSSNAIAVTANGNAQISTTQSKFGGASAYFNGTSDSLSFADPSLGTGDFTIEMWIKTNSSVQYAQLIGNESGGGSSGYTLLINNNSSTGGQITLYVAGGSTVSTGSGDWSDDSWHNIALTRSGTTFRLFVDGVLLGTGTNSASMSSSTGITTVARNPTFAPRNMVGYIDELRITKGVARYTSNFTPPTGPHLDVGTGGDLFYPSTSLLLHMDGSNGSTTFTDNSSSPLTVTANGNAQISTAQSKFGGASGAFDGTGDWLAATLGSAIGTSDFTLEAWIYLNSLAATQPIICLGDDSTATGLLLFINTSGRVSAFGDNASIATGTTQTMATSTWNHVAISRSGTSIRLFVNGINDGTATNSANLSNATTQIGRELYNSATGAQLNGYIDELRITKGVARYTANFTPPSAPFPNL